MKSPVKLYLRVRLPDGSYPYLKAAFSANGRLRPHHAIHAGRATEFPGSTYHLRYQAGKKRVWEAIAEAGKIAHRGKSSSGDAQGEDGREAQWESSPRCRSCRQSSGSVSPD